MHYIVLVMPCYAERKMINSSVLEDIILYYYIISTHIITYFTD